MTGGACGLLISLEPTGEETTEITSLAAEFRRIGPGPRGRLQRAKVGPTCARVVDDSDGPEPHADE